MLAMLLATISGTLFLYQGQEIGAVNAPESWPMAEYKDVESNNYYAFVREKTNGDAAALSRAKAAIQHLARDHARMPMQWDATFNAGFSSSPSPWMRVNDNYAEINVTTAMLNRDSILSFWKKMLRLRKEYSDLFVRGAFMPLDVENEQVLTFEKKVSDRSAFVVLNFTDSEQPFPSVPGLARTEVEKLIGNYDGEDSSTLRPFEGVVFV